MKRLATAAVFGLLLLGGALVVANHKTIAPAKTTTNQSNTASSKVTSPDSSSFDKAALSTTNPSSPWVVVNKQHPLNPISYAPTDLVMPDVAQRVPGNESMQLRQQTATALHAMFSGAEGDGLKLMLSSGYRSYSYQINLYNGYVKTLGQAQADAQSARPGHSEHQTGLAADIEPASKKCELEQCFADTQEGKWLVENSYKYGFILRYTTPLTSITGYSGEPWHYRYVGVPLTTELDTTGVSTLEQYFNISGGEYY